MAEVAVQPLLQELLARIERIEKKIDLLVEELPESEIEELRKEVKEFAEKNTPRRFQRINKRGLPLNAPISLLSLLYPENTD